MRIWSIHPKYLDSKGLVALWRETLLAKHVLEGKTKGYIHHPQLNRFRSFHHPLNAINQYLNAVYHEASARDYNFNRKKFKSPGEKIILTVTEKQIEFEFGHLLRKLCERDKTLYKSLKNKKIIESHPIFKIIAGPIEPWEVI
ncbi:MAG: pyrimidine dimer DNA glycosylase/endonuclease V [Chitinophagales bacterium]